MALYFTFKVILFLIILFLDEASENSPRIKIRVSPDKLGFFREDKNNDIPLCPKLEKILKDQIFSRKFSSGMSAFKPLLHKISQLFNISTPKMPGLTQ